jgi:hypothetical protein
MQAGARFLFWLGRLTFVVVALWWPPVWRDPIYSPRYAQVTGQELRLPNGRSPQNDEERAVALFWRWEHRSLVTTEWVVGSYRGLRANNPDGWTQTLIALSVVVLLFNVLLARWVPPPSLPPDAPKKKASLHLSLVSLWRFLQRRPRDKGNPSSPE